MRLTFPALKATCEAHTVQVDAQRVAGWLVRHSGTRQSLGYVWRKGPFWWGWSTMDAQHFGERGTQRAAVEVLADIAKLGDPALSYYTRSLPFEVEPPPVPPPAPKPPRVVVRPPTVIVPPAPPPPPKPIQWSEAPDLTAAVEDALRRRKGGS